MPAICDSRRPCEEMEAVFILTSVVTPLALSIRWVTSEISQHAISLLEKPAPDPGYASGFQNHPCSFAFAFGGERVDFQSSKWNDREFLKCALTEKNLPYFIGERICDIDQIVVEFFAIGDWVFTFEDTLVDHPKAFGELPNQKAFDSESFVAFERTFSRKSVVDRPFGAISDAQHPN